MSSAKDLSFDDLPGANEWAASEMPIWEQALAGAGKAFVDVGRGAGQMMGLYSRPEADEAKRMDAPLMNTGAGAAGNIGAQLLAALVPGTNTLKGAALVGGAIGALEPVTGDESRLKNVGVGAGLGAAGQKAAGFLANRASAKLVDAKYAAQKAASRNKVLDETLREVTEAGYRIPPSAMNAGPLPRAIEGLAGAPRVKQLATEGGQEVTDSLVRRGLGVADDFPLTQESLSALRHEVYKVGYKPVEALQSVNWDHSFLREIMRLRGRAAGGATTNPADEKIGNLAKELYSKKSWSGDELVADIRNLRQMANENFGRARANIGDVGAGNLASAQQRAANLLEDLAERNLANNKAPKDTIANFRDARKQIAKIHDVEDAVREGSGHADARIFGAKLQRGDPLTEELATIGKYGNVYKDIAGIPQTGQANPFTNVDLLVGMGGSVIDPTFLAYPLLRRGTQSALLSKPMQRMMAERVYGPGITDQSVAALLDNPLFRASGLFGPAAYFGQQ